MLIFAEYWNQLPGHYFCVCVFVYQDRQTYEKVGEPTEVALKVLAEKLNVQGLNREAMTKEERAMSCHQAVFNQYRKVWCVYVCVCVRVCGEVGKEKEGETLSLLVEWSRSVVCNRRILRWSFLAIGNP